MPSHRVLLSSPHTSPLSTSSSREIMGRFQWLTTLTGNNFVPVHAQTLFKIKIFILKLRIWVYLLEQLLKSIFDPKRLTTLVYLLQLLCFHWWSCRKADAALAG